jgi:hypothetical protein
MNPASSNKRMQLTKLTAAPVRRAEVPPCAPAGETDGGTASQLIRSVRRAIRVERARWSGRQSPRTKPTDVTNLRERGGQMMLLGWVLLLGGLVTILAREDIARHLEKRRGWRQRALWLNNGDLFLIIGVFSGFAGLVVIILNLQS